MTKSNETTIYQMNEVIGVFMGYTMYNKRYPRNHGIGAPECEPEKCMIIQKAKYHTSWDWLIPVVEKIEDVQLNDKNNVVTRAAANVQIFYRACLIQYEPDEESGDTNDEASIQTKGETKLEAVHKAAYQFIQWYNQQKQNNGIT